MVAHLEIIGENGFEYYYQIKSPKDLEIIKMYINTILEFSDIINSKPSDNNDFKKVCPVSLSNKPTQSTRKIKHQVRRGRNENK